MYRELHSLSSAPGVMVPNSTVLVHKEETVKLEKANIFEAEVHALAADALASAPTFRAVNEAGPCKQYTFQLALAYL